MPHITIEYSANLDGFTDIDMLVDRVHAAALDHGLAPLTALRTRAVAREHYRIADGDPSYVFVAVVARIGPGRDPAEKQTFLETLVDTAEGHLAEIIDAHPVALSAEIQEIDASFRINRNHVRAAMQARRPDDERQP